MYHFRIRAMLIVIFGALLMVATRLFYLQIIEGHRYEQYAENVRLATHTLPTLRGRIFSADGVLLAADLPAFDVGVRYDQLDPPVPGSRWRTAMLDDLRKLAEVRRDEELKAIRGLDVSMEHRGDRWLAIVGFDLVVERAQRRPGLLGRFLQPVEVEAAERREGDIEIPPSVIERAQHLAEVTREPLDKLLARIVEAGVEILRERASARQPITVVGNVGYPLVRFIECRADLFEGFGATRRAARSYPCGPLACHTIGYLTVADEDDLHAHGGSYHGDPAKRLLLGDEIARSGVEVYHDDILRGRRGQELAEVDYLHRKQKALDRTAPVPGHDLHLTLDTRWQRAAEHALQRAANVLGRSTTAGAIAVIDLDTGAVLAVASHPGYDLNTFRRDFGRLSSAKLSPDKPLLNRGIGIPLPPGSVFKIVDAVAATNAGMSTTQTYDCTGEFRIGHKKCHLHYTMDLAGAIQKSCNIFFWEAALQAGAQRLADQARELGLGAKTGIDTTGERAGHIASPRDHPPWYDGDTLNMAIGQGEVEATPLQVARMMAAVANGGKLYRPYLKLKVVAASGEEVEPPQPAAPERIVEIRPDALDVIRRAMKSVTTETGGTCYKTFRGFSRFSVAGKTGTAERPAINPITQQHYKDNVGWFAGFAPADQPRVAFAVVLEHLKPEDSAGDTAGRVARILFETVPAERMPGQPTTPLMPIEPGIAAAR